jgi:enamine deaminase RidA (YjgF/YER057c/UK114 family)
MNEGKCMTGRIERRLAELGVELPRPPRATGNFTYGVEHGGILYLSGTYGTSVNEADQDYLPIVGKLGGGLSVGEGYRSARLMAINHLAMAKAVLGDLDRIERVIRLLGFVNAARGFRDAPKVLNGASDFLVEVFGPEHGRHARSALYQHELAGDAPVAGELMLAVGSPIDEE